MTAKTQRRTPNHYFRFKLENGRVMEIPVKVRRPRKAVTIMITPEDVEEAIRLDGVGNIATCSMAVCVTGQADKFPHKVIGLVDWYYRRAYIVSKAKQGRPTECYLYEHADGIARLNDTPGGQQKLLEILRETGPRPVILRPVRKRKAQPLGRPEGGYNKSRSRVSSGRGAKLRLAVAASGAAGPVRLPRKLKKAA